MCNLYSMTADRESILRLFGVSHNRATAVEAKDAIFPGHDALVVRIAPDTERELVTLSWGFVLPRPGKAPRRVTNTRDDKVLSSFWRDSFHHRRCLIPATSFAEPKQVTPATWHWFAMKRSEPRPLFAFTGLWRQHAGPIKKDGPAVELDVFSFMTTPPNPLVGSINHERMPVLLSSKEDFKIWLSGTSDAAFNLVTPYPADRMQMVPVGI